MRKFLAALLTAALLSLPAAAIGPADDTLMEGMDISVYQGSVDFPAAKAAGIQAVYIRAGYGEEGEDSYFRSHAQGAQAAGLHFGFYYYVTARSTEEGAAQARRFAALIDGISYDCRPVMDFEALDGLTEEEASEIALAFLTQLESLTGHRPMVYADDYNASNRFDGRLASYPLWAAAYGPNEPQVTAHWTAWTGFQYTDKGVVPGVGGYVDRDHFTPGILLDAQPAPGPLPDPGDTLSYSVVRGDTLWAIARRYCTTVERLAGLNHISNPNLIYPGQVLRLPAP